MLCALQGTTEIGKFTISAAITNMRLLTTRRICSQICMWKGSGIHKWCQDRVLADEPSRAYLNLEPPAQINALVQLALSLMSLSQYCTNVTRECDGLSC
jgi:hypothetical protein